ncbi:MAG: zf-HC2 domain-containing protein [Gemmataceae bacterium]|nr:zf-HC2 domain-containing protein [Gemmataceae bacterium]
MNVTCKQVAELLADYLNEELESEQKNLLDWHLCGCVPCKIYLVQYREVIITCRKLPDAPLPTEFSSRLAKLLGCKEPPPQEPPTE